MADAAATTTAAPPAVTTVAALPSIVFASLAGSAVLVELTVPQIVRLSLPTKTPLPNTPLAARIAMQPRLLGPQTALTTLQFGLTREVRDLLDRALGPNKLHLSAAYGVASGPCRAAAYNLLIAGVRPASWTRRDPAGAPRPAPPPQPAPPPPRPAPHRRHLRLPRPLGAGGHRQFAGARANLLAHQGQAGPPLVRAPRQRKRGRRHRPRADGDAARRAAAFKIRVRRRRGRALRPGDAALPQRRADGGAARRATPVARDVRGHGALLCRARAQGGGAGGAVISPARKRVAAAAAGCGRFGGRVRRTGALPLSGTASG